MSQNFLLKIHLLFVFTLLLSTSVFALENTPLQETITTSATGSFILTTDAAGSVTYTYPPSELSYAKYTVLSGAATLAQKDSGKLTFAVTTPGDIQIDFTVPKKSFGSSTTGKAQTVAKAGSASSTATMYTVDTYTGFGSGSYVANTPQRVSLSAFGEYFFKVYSDRESHVIRVLDIQDDTVVLVVQKDPITLTLQDGDSVDIDADHNGEYDATIKLISHSKTQVSFTIAKFSGADATVPQEEVVEEPVVEETVEEPVVEITPEPEVEEPIEEPVVEEVVEPTPEQETIPEPEPTSQFVIWMVVIAAIIVCAFIAIAVFMLFDPHEERDHVEKPKKKK